MMLYMLFLMGVISGFFLAAMLYASKENGDL